MLICPLNSYRILATTLHTRFGILLRMIESSYTCFPCILANAPQMLHTNGRENYSKLKLTNIRVKVIHRMTGRVQAFYVIKLSCLRNRQKRHPVHTSWKGGLAVKHYDSLPSLSRIHINTFIGFRECIWTSFCISLRVSC